MKRTFYLGLLSIATLAVSAQGLVKESMSSAGIHAEGCGSHEYILNQDRHTPNFSITSDQYLQHVVEKVGEMKNKKKSDDVYEIEVVFHVVYENAKENIPDSVLINQLEMLNNCFRRTNADTVNLRPEFRPLVADAGIQFKLANVDPNGQPTNGITRTSTDVTNFGGILPYGQGQNFEILQWFNDSFYLNISRLAKTAEGGIDPWDTDHYLNIWIGDMRILEPKMNDLQELVFFALATPPIDHEFWSGQAGISELLTTLNDGVYLHFPVPGPNNPSRLEPPYNNYNGTVTEGKLLVHEVGHYLGLRHIWGDGNCGADDFIDDTPLSNASSNYSCNKNKNSCADNIFGQDLFDMVENYMDYSGHSCQNSFTRMQTEVMREVVSENRGSLVSVREFNTFSSISVYPNPSTGTFSLDLENSSDEINVTVFDSRGRNIYTVQLQASNTVQLPPEITNGIYTLEIVQGVQHHRQKLAVMRQ